MRWTAGCGSCSCGGARTYWLGELGFGCDREDGEIVLEGGVVGVGFDGGDESFDVFVGGCGALEGFEDAGRIEAVFGVAGAGLFDEPVAEEDESLIGFEGEFEGLVVLIWCDSDW